MVALVAGTLIGMLVEQTKIENPRFTAAVAKTLIEPIIFESGFQKLTVLMYRGLEHLPVPLTRAKSRAWASRAQCWF